MSAVCWLYLPLTASYRSKTDLIHLWVLLSLRCDPDLREGHRWAALQSDESLGWRVSATRLRNRAPRLPSLPA